MGEHQRLKELILGEELAELNAHAERVAVVEENQATLPQQLPDLLQRAQLGAGRQRLSAALARPVADALTEAVQQQRQTIVEALFPVIGPAIRKAIAEALRDFNESFNQALESSFTPRGLRWRVESWRTGLPYAQVVMRHSLQFRVEHLFLIDRSSGLVLTRESAADLPDLDADAIAGMLTAIGDFVRDSVGSGDSGTLDAASVGEYLVWVLQGPQMNLAAFVRGAPPPELRLHLRERLERIHAWRDDPQRGLQAGAADTDLQLHEVLRLDALEKAVHADAAAHKAAPARRWPLLLLGLAALALLGFWEWQAWQWRQRVESVRQRLEQWPGLHLDRVDGERGKLQVRGLIDSDAQAPLAQIQSLLPPGVTVDLQLRSYLSGEDAIVLRRAQRQLAPPPGVQVRVRDGTLLLSGTAAAEWIAQASQQAAWLAGVVRVDASALRPAVDPAAALRAEWDRLVQQLPAQRVLFARELEARDAAALPALLAAAARLRELAAALQRPLRLQCRGHTDEQGAEAKNIDLRARRAEWLCAQLRGAGFTDASVRADAGEAPGIPSTIDQRAASLQLDIEAQEQP